MERSVLQTTLDEVGYRGIKFKTIVEHPSRQDGAPRINDGLNCVSPSAALTTRASLPYFKPVI